MPLKFDGASKDEWEVTVLLPISKVKATEFHDTWHVEADIPWPAQRSQRDKRDRRILPHGPTTFWQVRFKRVQEFLVKLHVAACERAKSSNTRRLPEVNVIFEVLCCRKFKAFESAAWHNRMGCGECVGTVGRDSCV